MGIQDALPHGNVIIDAIGADARSVLPHADVVTLRASQMTTVYARTMTTVDFPVTALMSIVGNYDDGATAEITTIGREGFVEVDAALHHDVALRTSICLLGGTVIRVPLQDFQRAIASNAAFGDRVYHAVRARSFITEQLTLCGVRHSSEQRFARWLLMAAYKLRTTTIEVTQEAIAGLLGTRRATVTLAAQQLAAQGAISYVRGKVSIADQRRLEQFACCCLGECMDALNDLGLTP